MILFIFGLLMAPLFGSLSSVNIEKLAWVDCCDPLLEDVSGELSLEMIRDPHMQRLFDAMFLFAKGEQSDLQKHVLVGLAAPQIGMNLRIILVDTQADGKGHVSQLCLYINPEILSFSEETEEWYEGCFSTGDVKGVVRRPKEVTIKALNREGKEICETHTGYVGRIFQHEIDHLNGIRFPDRVPDGELLHLVKAKEMYLYRNEGGWRNWPNTIAQRDWKKYMQEPVK